jgi:hypothetical protein
LRRSDGAQPHLVNISFQRKVELLVRPCACALAHTLHFIRLKQRTHSFLSLQELALYVDFKLDESYTPKNISIRAGNSVQDMKARPQLAACSKRGPARTRTARASRFSPPPPPQTRRRCARLRCWSRRGGCTCRS